MQLFLTSDYTTPVSVNTYIISLKHCIKHCNLSFSLLCFSVTLQVQLLYELLLSWSSTWARLQRHGILRQTSSIPEPPASAAPSSPVRSSAGTALPDTSTCSPSADFGSPTEVCFAHPATHFIGSVFINLEYQESAHLSFSFNQSAICVLYFTLLLLFQP